MTDLCLKFDTEEQSNELLYTQHEAVTDADGNVTQEAYSVPKYLNIDTLGTLYNNDAVVDAEGNITTPATAIYGWHVNVRLMDDEDGAELEPFSVVPAQPRRVWA